MLGRLVSGLELLGCSGFKAWGLRCIQNTQISTQAGKAGVATVGFFRYIFTSTLGFLGFRVSGLGFRV